MERVPGRYTRPPFTDPDFTATQFTTADDKAWFAKRPVPLHRKRLPPTLWTKRLYHRLSLCFGHIAHTNSDGFWSEFFDRPHRQGRLSRRNARRGAATAIPTCTYCDVERRGPDATAARATCSRPIARCTRPRSNARERALLARLRAKYRRSAGLRRRARRSCLPASSPPRPPAARRPRTSPRFSDRRPAEQEGVPHHRRPPQGSRRSAAARLAGCALAPASRDAAGAIGSSRREGRTKSRERNSAGARSPWPNFARVDPTACLESPNPDNPRRHRVPQAMDEQLIASIQRGRPHPAAARQGGRTANW